MQENVDWNSVSFAAGVHMCGMRMLLSLFVFLSMCAHWAVLPISAHSNIVWECSGLFMAFLVICIDASGWNRYLFRSNPIKMLLLPFNPYVATMIHLSLCVTHILKWTTVGEKETEKNIFGYVNTDFRRLFDIDKRHTINFEYIYLSLSYSWTPLNLPENEQKPHSSWIFLKKCYFSTWAGGSTLNEP